MTDKKNDQVQNGGRKFKPIDWDIVDKLLEAGCPGTEIAPHFGVHYETLYDRAYTDHGIMWTEYSQQRRSKGDSNLRVKQYQEAMKGDRGMLIWLGKQRLDQRERYESKVEHSGLPAIPVVNFGDIPNPKPYQTENPHTPPQEKPSPESDSIPLN